MSGGLALPPPQPPEEDLQELLEELRLARRAMADAAQVLKLVAIDRPAAMETPHLRQQYWIETEVAERRCELWAVRIRQLEQRARQLGLRP